MNIQLITLRIVFLLVLTSFYACKSDVETIQVEIDNTYETEITASLKPVVATMYFYLYAVQENYWYPEGTTGKEMMSDGLKIGYSRLGKLDNVISGIETDDLLINSAIDSLHNSIKIARKNLRNAQKAMEQINSVFGFGLYGGMNTLYDLSSMFGEQKESDSEDNGMPKEVKLSFENLREAIANSNFIFLNQLHDFEQKVIGSRNLSKEKKNVIRNYLKQKVKNSIDLYYEGSDTTDRNKATERLFVAYDNYIQH